MMTTIQEVFQCEAPVALVTGSGAPRVGRAVAEHLASLGCSVALHANSSTEDAERVAASLESQYGRKFQVVSGALDVEETPERIVRETCERFGRMDILVNSAAIWHPTPLEEITSAEVMNYLEVNALGSFMCARAAGLAMVDQSSGGSIINIGDWATVRPYLDHAAYFPSKGAVEAMTRSLAVELAQRNPRIRVNCIQPGPVLLGEETSDEYAARMASTTLVGRVGTAEHVAHAVQFLCENDFVNGVCLPIDGGRSIYAPDGIQTNLKSD